MKKYLSIIFLIIAIILYVVGIYQYSQTESFILLLIPSIIIAIAATLFKSNNKKEKNKIKFEVDKVEIKKEDNNK